MNTWGIGESAAGGSMLMSSSSDNKTHNMLYADSHAPYLYIHRNQPLSVWVITLIIKYHSHTIVAISYSDSIK